MNKLLHSFFCNLWFIFGIVFSLSNVPSHAESLITLLDESSQSLTLELTTPAPVISEKQLSGNTYQAIHIAGTGYTHDQGKPQLLIRGTLIAVPEGSEIQLEILDSDTEILSGILLPPAPTFNPEQPETFIPEPQSYEADHFQPASPVKIGLIGRIREQRVAQIQFFPVQHNPVQQTVKLYKRLRVRVSFYNDTRKVSEPVVEDSPAFDQMLSNLLINDATSNRVLRRSTRTTRDSCPPLPPALKISIDKTGVYAITYADILASGVDLSVLDAQQVSQLHMTYKGRAVPIFVAGVEDGQFGPGDALYFYAEGADGPYTRNNVYRLSLRPAGGARINLKDGAPASYPQITNFRQTVHVEKNTRYWSRTMHDSTGNDHLFWEKLQGDVNSLEMPVTLHHVAPSGNATIRVMLQGKSDDVGNDPDHHTKIWLNGVEVHNALWNGQKVYQQEVSVPQAKLREGANTVTLVSAMDTEATVDSLYVNWLEIEYTAKTSAVQEELTFEASGEGQHNMTVSGFSGLDMLVLDVTDPLQVVPLLEGEISTDSTGGFKIRYADNLDGGKTYYAFSFSKLLKPAAISIDLPIIRLQCAGNQADYFIIYHDSFNINALQSLVADRGKNVMAVPVSDIYDEFNHGMPDPQAIKDFLTYAYENYAQPRPSYVVLVGDANQDTLNELGHGINYVPTHSFHTVMMGETTSDNWFVSGEDSLPDMFLGRIPVKTQAELNAVVNKLTRYPEAPLDGWEQNVLLVADNDERGDFENLSKRLIDEYLTDYSHQGVYLGLSPNEAEVNAVRQNIIQSINAGAILTNYTGHGSINFWAGTGERMFRFEDVALLNNPDKLTFVVALNCQNGWFSFHQPFAGSSDSFAEVFLKADGKGAIGMFASTGLGYTHEHEIIVNELFKRLFNDKKTEIGPLITQAKIVATNLGVSIDNMEMFTLFGDPNLRLRLQ
ncbi:MAG: C25 family cysteine peptidase [Pseudomonadota bacterium]